MRQRQGAGSHKCRYSFKNMTTEGRKEQVGEGKKEKFPAGKSVVQRKKEARAGGQDPSHFLLVVTLQECLTERGLENGLPEQLYQRYFFGINVNYFSYNCLLNSLFPSHGSDGGESVPGQQPGRLLLVLLP